MINSRQNSLYTRPSGMQPWCVPFSDAFPVKGKDTSLCPQGEDDQTRSESLGWVPARLCPEAALRDGLQLSVCLATLSLFVQ